MSSKARIAALQQRSRQWWQGLAARERRGLLLSAVLLGALVLWSALIQPALARISHWQMETPRLRSQAQALDALLAQAPAPAAVLPGDQLEQALRQSLEDAGLGCCYQLERAETPGGWQLQLHKAPADAVLNWLQRAPTRFALAVGQAHLQRDPAAEDQALPATLSATLRMDQAQGAKEPS